MIIINAVHAAPLHLRSRSSDSKQSCRLLTITYRYQCTSKKAT